MSNVTKLTNNELILRHGRLHEAMMIDGYEGCVFSMYDELIEVEQELIRRMEAVPMWIDEKLTYPTEEDIQFSTKRSYQRERPEIFVNSCIMCGTKLPSGMQTPDPSYCSDVCFDKDAIEQFATTGHFSPYIPLQVTRFEKFVAPNVPGKPMHELLEKK